jgi:dynein heavy chain
MNHYISQQIGEISRFLDSSKDNIEIRNKQISDDVSDLLKVMTSLKQLEDRKDEIDLTLDRIEEVLHIYEKKYDKKKELEMKKTHKLMDETKTINHVATRVDKEITGPKNAEAGRTKEKIKKF